MNVHPVLRRVEQLIELLTQRPVGSEQVVAALGPVLPFPGTGTRVTPGDPSLSRADVFSQRQTGHVTQVSVTLAETSALRLADLTAHFGPSEEIGSPNMLESATSVIIPLASKQMSLIAESRGFFQSAEDSMIQVTEDLMIQEITVRLD